MTSHVAGRDHDIAIVPSWPAPARVRAYSTLRTGGVSDGGYASLNLGAHVGDDPVRVAENRRRVVERLGLPSEPCWLEQVHGKHVLDLAPEPWADGVGADPGPRPGLGPADAAVTSRPGVVCVVLTADCVPVLLTDRAGRRVGAAHAGWRGLAGGVLPAAVDALGVPPDDVLAWLGPAIGPRAFEVGDEVRAAFAEQGFAVDRAFDRNARGRWQADLYALAAESLRRAGVSAIYGGDRCTFTEADRFFSHRRAAPCGRMASLIWIE
ncbi:MAG TPA: peptidoglycan editing factor PgeF [Gammaproteobacteria bacterium]